MATWRVDAPRYLTTDTGSLGRAEWCHQVCTSNPNGACAQACQTCQSAVARQQPRPSPDQVTKACNSPGKPLAVNTQLWRTFKTLENACGT